MVPARPVSGGTVGTDWGQTVHDTIVSWDLQAGRVNVTIAGANASAAVTFARPFSGAPFVVAAISSAPGGSNRLIARTTSQGPTGCTVLIYTADGAAANVTVSVDWIAYGPRQ
jgi:hypothetical protein